MTKKVMKLIDTHESIFECKVCGARHVGLLYKPDNGHTRFKRGVWQCLNGCKLPEKTAKEKLLDKVKRQANSVLKTQAKFEKLRKSDKWESLDKETKERLDEMSGGVWLEGNESVYEKMLQ